MKIDLKKISRLIGYHGKTLFKGFVKMFCGAVMAGLIAGAIYGYTIVPTEGGYAAVSDFLVSTLFLVIALCGTYLMGGNCKKGAKK